MHLHVGHMIGYMIVFTYLTNDNGHMSDDDSSLGGTIDENIDQNL